MRTVDAHSQSTATRGELIPLAEVSWLAFFRGYLRYWDDVWTNPLPLQALQREGNDGGGLEHGSGAFDIMSQSWPPLTARRPKGKKAEKNANGTVPRCSSGRVVAPSRSAEESPIIHQEDEHDDVQCEKRVKRREQAMKPADRCKSATPALPRGQSYIHSSTNKTAPSAAKCKSTLAAAAPAPRPKRRKAENPIAGWAIKLAPGDKTTAVSPRDLPTCWVRQC
ncbi:hypothetical protein B0H11DRAFT_1927825 [Mycena galericulata]|nr:hypothetical protein B0H11DRAFT_1927825 [Mycena galericulata]